MKLIQSLLLFALAQAFVTGCTQSTETGAESPAGSQSELPYLFTDDSGALMMSWVEPVDTAGTYRLLYSKLEGEGWSEPSEIAQSNEWFVNWADYPSIVSWQGQAMAAHWLKKVPGNTYSYNVNLSMHKKSDGWTEPLTPHFDSTATEHGFVSMRPWNEDQVLAVWLDGRQTHQREEDEYFDLDKAMTLRSALISRSGEVTEKKLIDDSVCDCCNTSLAITSDGAIAAYRNRTDEEIRDIYVSRYRNGSWSQGVPVASDNWNIGACPVNGPRIAAAGSKVAVAWYTGAGNTPAVKAAFSDDGGSSFGEAITLSSDKALGRVDIAIDESGHTYISWMDREGDQAFLKVKRFNEDGTAGSDYTITEMSSSRRSGFPQMELHGNQLVFAWTDIAEQPKVNVLRLPVSTIP